MNDHAKGLLITAIGGLVLTIDIPLIMLAGGDIWSVVLLRSGCAATAATVFWLVWKQLSPSVPPLIPGSTGLLIATIYGVAAIFFTLAVFNTSAANLVFILAFNSMFAALLSWLLLGERPASVTLVTMVIVLGAVGLIVSDSHQQGTLVGDGFAVITSLLLAFAITLTRKSGKDMGFAPMLGGIIPVAVALVVFASADLAFSIENPAWVVINGAIVLPIAFWCLATGPKYITGPEVGMFYLLETVLTPVWVWLIFNEAVTGRKLVGGTIIVVALLAHSIVRLRSASLRRTPPAIRRV